MSLLPDWLPNIHPFIVHFPVGLLLTAVIAEFIRLLIRHSFWLNRATILLYIAGTIGLFAAYITGQQAIDTVSLSGGATSVAANHEEWALYTCLFFLLFTPLRVTLHWRQMEGHQASRWGSALLALIGGGLLWQTGELGAELVYKHGVGVGEVSQLQEQVETLERTLAGQREEAGPVLEESGAWSWFIVPGAADVLSESFIVEGSDRFGAETGRDDDGYFLILTPDSDETFLIFDRVIGDIEGTVELNADHFSGAIQLVHHYQNPDTYQYLKLEGSRLTQGQRRNGTDDPLDSETLNSEGWITLRVSASGAHFYGYKNRQTLLHTHADEMNAGKSGLSIRGSGELKIRFIEYTPVD